MRLFYATAAPADFIAAHKAWEAGEVHHSEVSLTFSGQVADFVEGCDGSALMVSGHPDSQAYRAGRFEIRHMPMRARSGIMWRAEYLRHGLRLFQLARDWGADAAVIDSGSMPWAYLELFRRSGIKAIPVFHNALYPIRGPTAAERLILPLTRAVLSRTTPISVSPACRRQVGGLGVRAQFRRAYFEKIAAPRFSRPFNVLFVGRVEANKGVFDIVEAARLCGPAVTWTICGNGSDLPRLKAEARGLPIDVRGWTSPEDQIALRSECQAFIVPTQSTFAEGMAMSAVEAILSRRPLVTNRAVPALEVLRPACIEVEPDSATSIAEAVASLAENEHAWQRLVDTCASLGAQFFNRRMSLSAALAEILTPWRSNYCDPDLRRTSGVVRGL